MSPSPYLIICFSVSFPPLFVQQVSTPHLAPPPFLNILPLLLSTHHYLALTILPLQTCPIIFPRCFAPHTHSSFEMRTSEGINTLEYIPTSTTHVDIFDLWLRNDDVGAVLAIGLAGPSPVGLDFDQLLAPLRLQELLTRRHAHYLVPFHLVEVFNLENEKYFTRKLKVTAVTWHQQLSDNA